MFIICCLCNYLEESGERVWENSAEEYWGQQSICKQCVNSALVSSFAFPSYRQFCGFHLSLFIVGCKLTDYCCASWSSSSVGHFIFCYNQSSKLCLKPQEPVSNLSLMLKLKWRSVLQGCRIRFLKNLGFLRLKKKQENLKSQSNFHFFKDF